MYLEVKVEVPPTALFQGRGGAIVAEELVAATEHAVNLIHGAVVPATPVNVGMLRAGWQTKVDVVGGRAEVLGRVFNPLSYAWPVERGSRPHWPPIEPLVLWAKRKFSVTDKEARSIGFLVARKISRVGTSGAGMAFKAVQKVEGAIQARFNQMAVRILERLGR